MSTAVISGDISMDVPLLSSSTAGEMKPPWTRSVEPTLLLSAGVEISTTTGSGIIDVIGEVAR